MGPYRRSVSSRSHHNRILVRPLCRSARKAFSLTRINPFICWSGSAFPATLAFQIRELERETQGDFKLDAIVTVVDAENFRGYEDTSPTAKMQAQYTDVILVVSLEPSTLGGLTNNKIVE